ncbi:MAG: hypothetical protein ACRDZ4_04705 [Egibacteraceae bacterium]
MTAYGRIETAPTPPGSGTVATLAEFQGPRFPEPPFVVLIWTDDEVPILGDNAEELAVLTIEGDELTFERSSDPISITADMNIAVLSSVTVEVAGESVHVAATFPGAEGPYQLNLRKPSGGTVVVLNADIEANGTRYPYFDFEPTGDEQGLWHYRWKSSDRVLPEDDFFVSFSEVL